MKIIAAYILILIFSSNVQLKAQPGSQFTARQVIEEIKKT